MVVTCLSADDLVPRNLHPTSRFAAANTAIAVANQDEEQFREVIAFLQNKVVKIPTPDDLLRWNNYGIGLFLQGDLRGAEAA